MDNSKTVCFVHGQIRYALGDGSRSFVICDHRNLCLPGPNPLVLYGALVGGPNASDIYQDNRADARSNEVAIDYNAGFTGALAGLNVASINYSQCLVKGLKRHL
eukprot:gene4914-5158_t